MGFITKKRVMWGGIGALLLLVGAFLLWDPEPKPLSFGPVEWGQAKDYAISTEANGGTTVRNTREKYSFAVPKGWRVSTMPGVAPGEFFLDLLSPDAVLSDKKFIIQGCRILLETVYDEQNIMEIRSDLSSLDKGWDSERLSRITVDGTTGTKTIWATKEDALTKPEFPTLTSIRFPLSKKIALEFTLHTVPKKYDQCLATFSEFSDSVRFK